ncbi:MAG: lysophospholipid acyltransferase family protein [Chthoniobacteraceae bacterium]
MKVRGNERRLGKLAAALIRVIGCTLRISVEDRARLLDREFKQPMIWTFWHNRMFVLPLLRDRYTRHRTGAVLTSPSGDGEIIATVMECFGLKSVRGSSSRQGAAALLALSGTLEAGEDVAVTPDGPRGPRYKLGQGVVYLAQQTGAAILPIHIEYSRAVRLKSWDRFMIPLPFAKVRITCGDLIFVARGADIEAERARIEQLMQPKTE